MKDGKKSGVNSALNRNPNTHSSLNDAPDGPYAHSLGEENSGGMKPESKSVKGKHGGTFYFK